MSARQRLDALLVARGFYQTRSRARDAVLRGAVRVNGLAASKPSQMVAADAAIVIEDAAKPYVSRAALKLKHALAQFRITVAGRRALDIGASTGGFTQVLLERGARRVYAVDVGRAQLHERLRRDPRVVVLERINARTLSPREIPEPCSLAVMDVSFISVRKILPALRVVLATPAEALVLVKPQFELRRQDVGRGGLVRDPELHARAVREVAEAAIADGYALRGACASPIAGGEGNREFFLHLGVPGPGIGIEAAIALAREVTRP